jgi:hypothetical protein
MEIHMNTRNGLTAILATAAIALAACGGGSSDDAGTTAVASAGASYDISLGDWVAMLEDEKVQVLKDYVADTPSCDAEFQDRRFVLTIAGASTNFDPSTPLPDVIKKYC